MRHGAGMVDVGVGDQQKLDVAGIEAKFVNRFFDDFGGVGHASIEQNVPGRGRDQIGGKPFRADIIDGPHDPERLRRLDPSFQVGTQCGRHRLLSGERTADIRERRRKRFLRDRRPGENELKKDKNESHRCNRVLKMQGEPGFCNDDC